MAAIILSGPYWLDNKYKTVKMGMEASQQVSQFYVSVREQQWLGWGLERALNNSFWENIAFKDLVGASFKSERGPFSSYGGYDFPRPVRNGVKKALGTKGTMVFMAVCVL